MMTRWKRLWCNLFHWPWWVIDDDRVDLFADQYQPISCPKCPRLFHRYR